MIQKRLSSITLNISEKEYRSDPALSYSQLAQYNRTHDISSIYTSKSTPALIFGSAVDSIITGGMREFEDRFIVWDNKISDNLAAIIEQLHIEYKDTYKNLCEIPEDSVSNVAQEKGFWKDPKWDNRRAKEVLKVPECHQYYEFLFKAGGKKVLSKDIHDKVINAVRALYSNEITRWYFLDSPFENISREYQLKFKANLNGIDFRCMADLIIVLYDEKRIIPCDLKTSHHAENEFYKSFIDWSYQIQARLYWRIIRQNLDNDPYFKDFILEDYRFIIVNKENPNPLVWEFTDTIAKGPLMYGSYNQYLFPDPEDIAKDLINKKYNSPVLPSTTTINNIKEFIDKS